jgi:hypothetical protein
LADVNQSAKPHLIRSDPQASVSVEQHGEGFPANLDAGFRPVATHDRSHCVAARVRDPHIAVWSFSHHPYLPYGLSSRRKAFCIGSKT